MLFLIIVKFFLVYFGSVLCLWIILIRLVGNFFFVIGLRKLWLKIRFVIWVVFKLVGFWFFGYDGVKFKMILIWFFGILSVWNFLIVSVCVKVVW